MREVLQPSSVCIDVGASSGVLLRQMCELAPLGRHIALEPLPTFAARLREQFPGVEVHQAAAAAVPGESEFVHVVGNPAYSGLKRRRYDGDEQLEVISVPTVCLDDVVPRGTEVAFIKIDVEGGEYGVIEGGAATIRRSQPVIAFEHGGGWTTEAYGTNSTMLYRLLTDLGLQVSLLDDWLARRPSLSEEDFVRRQMVDGEFFFLAHPSRGDNPASAGR